MKQHPASTKDRLEVWLGKHNRKLELVRTLVSSLGVILTLFVFFKVFGIL